MATGRLGAAPVLKTRWTKEPTAGTTSLSGLDANSVSLVYSVGYEQVYRNGVLLSRGNDYTATDGTTITLTDATLTGDIIEVFANELIPLSDAIGKGQYNAKGALVSASAASTPATLAVGNNGDTLVADSSTTTGLRWNPLPVQTNPVLNGAFDIWQRGTSFTSNTAVYTADRWYQGANQNQGTVSRQDTNDTTNLPEIQYCLRYGRSNGATDTDDLAIQQSFENVNSTPFIGKTVTFSFYARKGANFSQSASTLTARLKSGTGTDQNLYSGFTGETNAVSISAVLTTTWQRFTGTATIATSAKQLGVQFFYAPVGTAGAADYFEITGVQVDVGSVALPFRRSGGTLAGELAACQRYCYVIPGRSVGAKSIGNGYWSSATNSIAFLKLPTMRVSPTLIFSSTSDFEALQVGVSWNAVSALALATEASADLAMIQATSTGGTAGNSSNVRMTNSTSAYIGFTAEL